MTQKIVPNGMLVSYIFSGLLRPDLDLLKYDLRINAVPLLDI